MPIFSAGRLTAILVLVLVVWWSPCGRAQEDPSRREYATPGLVVETGARTMACDVLTFSEDGQYLLAAGDDKVVRTWRFADGKLEKIEEPTGKNIPRPVLRWATYRERRGNIYAASLSPDQQFIAVGGLGVTNTQLAVLNRFSGKVAKALSHLSRERVEGYYAIWALAFSPAGDQVAVGTGSGSVWLWDLASNKPRYLGKHKPGQKTVVVNGREVMVPQYHLVRALVWHGPNQLISVAENGQVVRWPTRSDGEPTELLRLGNGQVRRIAFSKDGRRVAVALKGNRVAVSEAALGAQVQEIVLEEAARPSALTFDATGQRLAVAISIIETPARFHKEIDHRVVICDLSKPAPTLTAGPSATYRVEGLAFHPAGQHLALSGGDDHEVTVWKLADIDGGPTGRIASPGKCIWSVALAADGRQLAYQTSRAPNPVHPNQRGQGAWSLFGLNDLKAAGTVDALPSGFARPLLANHPEWTVDTASDLWTVVHRGKRYPLGLSYQNDSLPLCYTFLPVAQGANPHLLVGHYWGLSVFELIPGQGPFRVRWLVGHEGEVMALSLSADGKRLVSASRDQTVAGWSLEDWPSHPQLGAQFYLEGDKLMVGEVDTGSPAWESGLSKGDEIRLLVANNRPDRGFNRTKEYQGKVAQGTAAAALALLKKPEAGKELYFGWHRPGSQQLFEQLTTLRDRPLWRFFPTPKGDWVLWRWQDNFYAAAGQGDKWIGWQRNFFDFDKGRAIYNPQQTPRFFPAEQFQQLYERPDMVRDTLRNWTRISSAGLPFPLIEPPKVELQVQGVASDKDGVLLAGNKDLALTLKAVANSPRDNQQLDRVLLWINDYLVARWEGPDLKARIKAGSGLEAEVFYLANYSIPLSKLRRGENRLVLQCYNKAQVRGQARDIAVRYDRPRGAVALHGLFLGVNDYTQAKQPKYWESLRAGDDAEALAEMWRNHKSSLYQNTAVKLLKDQEVTAGAVKKQLQEMASRVQPDDLLIFFLGGHGLSREEVHKINDQKLAPAIAAQYRGLGRFLFICADFDFENIKATTINFEEIYDQLVRLPCHKLILLDACHAGAFGGDQIRPLLPDGVGPIIIAACKPEELAQEMQGVDRDPAYGLFARSLIKVMEEKFAEADSDGSKTLEPPEFFQGIHGQMQHYIRRLKINGQTPVSFLPPVERRVALVGAK